MIQTKSSTTFPVIRNAGVDGILISFADTLSESANRAALAFRHAIDLTGWSAIEETYSSLVSTYIRFDLAGQTHQGLRGKISALLAGRDWYAAELPQPRKLWRIPAVFGTDLAPQFDEAAEMAGSNPAQAEETICATRLRVFNIGFAPGQPYLGELPPAWDIPRQSNLTAQIPVGAICLAIRQLVMFSVPSPTGWRHVAQSAFRPFRPEQEMPFILRPGDEVTYHSVSREALSKMIHDPNGGAETRDL